MAYVIEDVPAGSTLEDLEIQVLDASGTQQTIHPAPSPRSLSVSGMVDMSGFRDNTVCHLAPSLWRSQRTR